MSDVATSQISSSPLSSPTGRSLLSRLTAPLRPRTRNLTDFHIRTLEPHRQYSPGDVVKGLVVLTVLKPVRITHLTVALHGSVRVFKSPNDGGEGSSNEPASMNGTTSRRSQYLGHGYASLFNDEVTLCGEGRLEVGVYEFEFNLEFPRKGLPTSIDFERGSISYIIRATITRPTSIAATSTYDRKLSLVETVDIGRTVPPKPRTISLQPILRRPKKPSRKISSVVRPKSEKGGSELENTSDTPQPTHSPNAERSASERPSSDHEGEQRSPVANDVQSETSGESVSSNSNSNSTSISSRVGPVSPPPNQNSHGSINKAAFDNQTINTTIELLKAGCLPGDNIPLRLTIQHTKFIKSMHGIIITLYRQGRIDYAPPLSMFTDAKGKAAERVKHEEYYPKSKTGLGGLSLSSTGSSSVFRKDLSQTFAPIILDPATMSTVVTTSIRVPEDVFPTITGVPGQMISFRYHIEVVVDLGGKLAAEQDKHLPRFSMTSAPSNYMNNGTQIRYRDGESFPSVLFNCWGGSIVDTDHIRREKSVVACVFEVIVGTTDSARKRGRGSILLGVRNKDSAPEKLHSEIFPGPSQHERNPLGDFPGHENTQPPTETFQADNTPHSVQGQNANDVYPQSAQLHAHASVPLPDVSPDEELSEKDRIRRAEERLLPSQPIGEGEPSFILQQIPTAPNDAGEDLYSPEDRQVPLMPQQIHLVSESRSDTLNLGNIALSPSAPTLEDLDVHAVSNASEDKREIERLRLMAEASAPPEIPEDSEDGGERGSRTQYEATAPVLTEEVEYGGDHPVVGAHHERLPRYER